jgi:hypothetical protein
VAVNKLYQTAMAGALGRKGYKALAGEPLYAALCRGLTFVWFAFTLLWFWSDWPTLRALWSAIGPEGVAVALLIAVLASSAVLEALNALRRKPDLGRADRPVRVAWASAQVTALWLIAAILAAPPPDIVYKTF